MKALILNSGMGTRLGELTRETPKCMTHISDNETIISRQIQILESIGVQNFLITTGPFQDKVIDHISSLNSNSSFEYVNNTDYENTNYIYSIYLAKELLQDDILLIHGDLVFSIDAAKKVIHSKNSCMVVSTSAPIPKDDFKAVIDNGCIKSVGVEFYNTPSAVTAQPFYNLYKTDWLVWLKEIEKFIDSNNNKVYAENAFNNISHHIKLFPLDIENELCREVDTIEDLQKVKILLN